LLAAIEEYIRPEIRERVRWQVKNSRVQHEPYGSEALLYLSKKVGPAEKERWYFSGLPAEVKWATVKFRVGASSVRAELWIVNGHLFSIKYDKDIRKLPDDEPVIIEKWIEHDDLSASAERPKDVGEQYTYGQIISEEGRYKVEALFNGQKFWAFLPADWDDPSWRRAAAKLGLLNPDDKIPLVLRGEARFFALLGDEPDFLGVRVGSEDGELYWVTHEDDAFHDGLASCGERFGSSMRAAVYKLLRSSPF
ncbi:MAG: hypothetical protein N3G20_02130, partial [Verrucomicrobiae bacterium]|nr:hypothetical protein [Verrucomicrobiae bacterium]